MIKLVYCVRKRADITSEKFHAYWLKMHGPLVMRVAKSIGARKYVQSHTIEPELNAQFLKSRGLAVPYDGITEVWWDSREALTAGMATPEGQAAHKTLLEDEATFIDFSQSRVFMTEEHGIFDL